MYVLILDLQRGIIKTKFAYLFFLAKWLSHSFDQMILRKKGAGDEGLVDLRFFGYLKR